MHIYVFTMKGVQRAITLRCKLGRLGYEFDCINDKKEIHNTEKQVKTDSK